MSYLFGGTPFDGYAQDGRRSLNFGGGGGGGGQPAQQTSTGTTYQTNIPEYLQAPTQRMVARGETLSEQGYQPYTGQRVAGFTPAQTAAFDEISGMNTPSQFGQASQSVTGAQQFGTAGALGAMGYQPTAFSQYQMSGPGGIGANQIAGTGYGAFGAQAAPGVTGAGYDAAQAQAAQAAYAPNVQGTGYSAVGAQAAPDVTAQALQYFQMANPDTWTQAGTQAQYMSPYQQAVTDIAKREATTEAALLNRQLAGQAAKAGAFGGSRFGVEQALLGSRLAQNLTDIQTKGSEAAYQAGLGQFNTEQAARQAAAGQNLQAALGVQSLGAGQNLQAGLANQQMRQQANLASQAAYNQALQFGATQEQAANLANQAAFQQTALANAGYTQQTNLANQAALNQFGLANQAALNQAGQFGATQAQQANLANQQVTQQANLASQQAYNQALQFGATQAQAAQIANQQAALTAAQSNQQTQLQTGIQNLSSLLTTQQQQEAARQAGAGINLQGAQFGAQTGLQAGTQLANLGTTSQQQELNRIQALAAAGEQQQALQQQQLSSAYNQFLEQRDWEKNQLGYLSGLIRGTPFSTTTTQGVSASAPSTSSQLLSAGLGVAGLASLLKKKGGTIDKTEGLSKKDKKKMMGEGLAKAGLYKAMGGA
jgi:hypothetical protein